jgi:starch synthase (maltosyl-transferring)
MSRGRRRIASSSKGSIRSSTAAGTRSSAWPGETFEVWADIFRDGHDVIAAALLTRAADERAWRRAAMSHVDNDRWRGQVKLERNIRHFYTIEAWTDVFASWRRDLVKKLDAQQDVTLELAEGRQALEAAAADAANGAADRMRAALARFDKAGDVGEARGRIARRRAAAADDRARATRGSQPYHRTLELIVDRKQAAFAAWYEMFPRSRDVTGQERHLRRLHPRLPSVRDLGFDVVYFVPIHPIGRTNRKGPNNSLRPAERSRQPLRDRRQEGGHDAIHPDLGTLERFRRLCAAPRARHGVALDFAIQCAPDHPWIKQHPSGSPSGPTAASSTPRIRRRSTRTSSTSTFSGRIARRCGTRCATSCCSGSSSGVRPSASTTRTPSRCRSGSG